MHQVLVSPHFRGRHSLYFHEQKKRFVLEYWLPSETPVKMTLIFPKDTKRKNAESYAKKKIADLVKGLLTDKEFKKYLEKSHSGVLWTIKEALDEYKEVTGIYKSQKQREKEKNELPKRFKFFIENFSVKMIHEVSESHLIDYRNHLVKQVQKGELAAASAPSFLANVKKVFNWLEDNKKILVNPAKSIRPIKVPIEKKVRTTFFTPEQIQKVMEAPFSPQNEVPIKELFLFAKETGARIGEILHLEWHDIKDGIWHIKFKSQCPTNLGLGWKPKWGKERKICLSHVALKILEIIPKVPSVGYLKNNPTPIPANFVFVIPDLKAKGQHRRVDDIGKTWKGLMKAAGLPVDGPDSFVRHDLRRTWNVEKREFGGMDDLQRAQQLGHSERVNQSHYAGGFNPDFEKLLMKLKTADSSHLLPLLEKEKE